MAYHLAADIGASGGKLVLGCFDGKRIYTEEVHRFSHSATMRDGALSWDIDAILCGILEGMKRCLRIGKVPKTLSIDTWGVDFVLLDKRGKMLGNAVSYRDRRTEGIREKVWNVVPRRELFMRTGTHDMVFNTIFQLCSIKLNDPEMLENAETLLMLPEYLAYLITGRMLREYTNATTTGLYSAAFDKWDLDLVDTLGIPKRLFGEVSMPGTLVGRLLPNIKDKIGYDLDVRLCASHDTGSAYMGVPAHTRDTAIISSGTWSLIGIERAEPIINEESYEANFTNEGGYDKRFRFLCNNAGLWIVQSLKREVGGDMDYPKIARVAEESGCLAVIDVNDDRFFSPDSMSGAIRSYCRDNGQPIPNTLADLYGTAYRSIAKNSAETIRKMEKLAGVSVSDVHIVGGGSRDSYLDKLIAKETGKTVYVGPVECSALGGLLSSMIAAGEIPSLDEARIVVRRSFDIKKLDA